GGSPIKGYNDLATRDVDISAIKSSDHRTIKVRVSVATEFNNTTPVLDSLMVKWRDPMTWRDEFYGDSRVARSLGLEVAG
ncbi:MAG: hypothetical protein GWN18_02605, partial [Thermoplasmata archaeon]|nr:hypothetical protein [Thermoplasmata archaeon]NIS10900.1 hypothetical protein [Thermoplasmata archaeon]NIS18830.1 hypothetical protein [Thermoplasmata archaeon]NIT75856.1 hypothetical protein [Thermoplasmata archaeon]NIU47990.1 hypothetical protein [Thermoplasmata archaeon]